MSPEPNKIIYSMVKVSKFYHKKPVIKDISLSFFYIVPVAFVATIYGWCRINPNLGPKGERSSWAERIASLPEIGLVLLIFLMMILGLIATGLTLSRLVPTYSPEVLTRAFHLVADARVPGREAGRKALDLDPHGAEQLPAALHSPDEWLFSVF